jgi:hypothetical protein
MTRDGRKGQNPSIHAEFGAQPSLRNALHTREVAGSKPAVPIFGDLNLANRTNWVGPCPVSSARFGSQDR